jgi:O-antigen/teichoic acid export membrane protein
MCSGLALVYYHAPTHLSLAAIWLTGLASFLAGLLILVKIQLLTHLCFAEIGRALAESWLQGRWALLGISVTWLQDQSYVYLLGILVSASSLAEANAPRLLLAPLALVNLSVMRILLPRWVNLRVAGQHESIRSSGRKAAFLMFCIVGAYIAVLLPFRKLLAARLLTSEYTDITVLLVLWGILFTVQSQRSNIAAQLQVFQQFRQITQANAASALLVVVVGSMLISWYGVRGSIVTLIVGEIVLTLLLWRRLRHVA